MVIAYVVISFPTSWLAVDLFYGQTAKESLETNSGQSGEHLYGQHCVTCHGVDLRGGNAPSLIDGDWRFGVLRWDKIRNIRFGISSVGMPAFGSVLRVGQIRKIVDFIDAAGKKLNVRRPSLQPILITHDYDVAASEWIPASAGLETPWAMVFVDEQTALVTERPGRLRVIRDGELQTEPIAGIPVVLNYWHGGLLDIALDPRYASNGFIYLSYSHPFKDGGNRAMTRLVRGKIRGGAWVDQEVIFEATPDTYIDSTDGHGSRILFGRDNNVYLSIGDFGVRSKAQDLSFPNGKIHRLHADGSIPSDNPFLNTPGAMPSIYSYGHRNPQGMATHPETGQIWASEHGPMGGDEINIIKSGHNYGWPLITYGIDYDSTQITSEVSRDGMQQPVFYWVPSIAVSSIAFYAEGPFERWKNNLLVAGLGHEVLYRLVVADDRVIHQEQLLKGQGRVRDINIGPDGAIYIVHNSPDRIIKLVMKQRVLRQ